jgi:hypothetical protein
MMNLNRSLHVGTISSDVVDSFSVLSTASLPFHDLNSRDNQAYSCELVRSRNMRHLEVKIVMRQMQQRFNILRFKHTNLLKLKKDIQIHPKVQKVAVEPEDEPEFPRERTEEMKFQLLKVTDIACISTMGISSTSASQPSDQVASSHQVKDSKSKSDFANQIHPKVRFPDQ